MLENLLYAFVLVFSIALASISVVAFRRTNSQKIALVTIAFLLFVAKGFLFSLQLFTDTLSQENLWIGSGFLDIGILGTMFFATMKR